MYLHKPRRAVPALSRRRAGQVFYLTILAISLLAAFTWLRSPDYVPRNYGRTLEGRSLVERDQEVRARHKNMRSIH